MDKLNEGLELLKQIRENRLIKETEKVRKLMGRPKQNPRKHINYYNRKHKKLTHRVPVRKTDEEVT